MTLNELFTLTAIVAGPIFAVFVTRQLDERREREARRMDVFRTLMRTRRTPTSMEHVGALNLIEIEFAKDGEVLAAWKELFKHFAIQHLRRPDEITVVPVGAGADDGRFFARLMDERQRLLAKLLHAMGRALRFKIEQLEIFEGGYTPQGWEDEYIEQRTVRGFLIDLYKGKVALPVMVFDGQVHKEAIAPEKKTNRRSAA